MSLNDSLFGDEFKKWDDHFKKLEKERFNKKGKKSEKLQLFAPRNKGKYLISKFEYVPIEERSLCRKPKGGLWTSTLIKKDSGPTSSWVEWCKYSMPDWIASSGVVLDFSDLNIYIVDSSKKWNKLFNKYGTIKNLGGTYVIEDIMWKNFFEDYDGIHMTEEVFMINRNRQTRNTYAWDVESTCIGKNFDKIKFIEIVEINSDLD